MNIEYWRTEIDEIDRELLRLLNRIVGAANSQGKSLTICGELAGDPKLTGLLLTLGIRRFSVAMPSR